MSFLQNKLADKVRERLIKSFDVGGADKDNWTKALAFAQKHWIALTVAGGQWRF